jgi:hypothetical protein
MRIRTMGDNGLDGRRIVVMPTSAEGLRGQQRDAAVKNEALVLADAIVNALDVIDLFEHQGGLVLVASGELRPVNSELLRWIVEATFVTKHVVRKLPGLGHEVELRPVNPNEMSIRAMLTKEPREGGLISRLPVLNVETQGFAAPAAPVEKEIASSPLPEVQAELLAGARTSARYANAAERTRLEAQRGAEVSARHAARQVKAETPAVVEESYPVYPPAEANDGAVDPATPPQA